MDARARVRGSWRMALGVGLTMWTAVGAGLAGRGVPQGGSRTVWAGAYSAAQAERGAKRYGDQCAMCHGAEMTGGGGVPGLTGVEFLFGWNNKTAAELFDYLKANMPPGQPGGLTDSQYTDVMAAMFKANGFPGGESDLSAERAALTSIRITRDNTP